MKTFIRRIEKFLHLPELGENDYKNETKSWIQIENGNFNWGDENITLKNINLEVKSNQLIAIVGSVGSGKSSLIQVFGLIKNGYLDKVTWFKSKWPFKSGSLKWITPD